LSEIDAFLSKKMKQLFGLNLFGVIAMREPRASSPFAVPIYLIVLLLAYGEALAAKAQPQTEDDSAAALDREINELYQQGKYKEAVPLAEKLVILIKHFKGEEDLATATSLNNLAELYQAMRDYKEFSLSHCLAAWQKASGCSNFFIPGTGRAKVALVQERPKRLSWRSVRPSSCTWPHTASLSLRIPRRMPLNPQATNKAFSSPSSLPTRCTRAAWPSVEPT
jgi:tetratricopeptide (TPR) repeat protein